MLGNWDWFRTLFVMLLPRLLSWMLLRFPCSRSPTTIWHQLIRWHLQKWYCLWLLALGIIQVSEVAMESLTSNSLQVANRIPCSAEFVMEGAWRKFCGNSGDEKCIGGGGCIGLQQVVLLGGESSALCIRDAAVSSIQFLFILAYLIVLAATYKRSRVRFQPWTKSLQSCVGILAAIAGFAYWGILLFSVVMKQQQQQSGSIRGWIALAVEGLTWVILAITTRIRRAEGFLRAWYAVNFILGSVLAVTELANVRQQAGAYSIMAVGTWPICCLLAVLAVRKSSEKGSSDRGSISEPLLNRTTSTNHKNEVCPISSAGWISRLFFLWLNPLLALGSKKLLEDADMPQVAPDDRAEVAHHALISSWDGQRSLSRALAVCYWKSFACNGVYALLKCLALSAGPLVLKSFVTYSKGDGASEWQGYALVGGLFIAKVVESTAQRQWLFGSKRLGMRMRSSIMAALYSKQLKISSSGRRAHATGEVMSYMAVDAYRIGEFGYWVQMIWSTPLQIVIAACILIHSVGAAASSAGLVMIGLSMIANRPMARLQRQFQDGLMKAQDRRLRATSAVLCNMKIVKLQAWEGRFKAEIEELRREEAFWLSKVQYRKTYNSFLFWLLPILVSTSTFGACWLLGSPLDASNVFTTLATFRIIQEPIRLVPDVISAIVQVRVSLARITRFLQEDELDQGAIDRKQCSNDGIVVDVQEASLSWDPEEVQKQLLRPTLSNISLRVFRGSRVAVCGEVGSGKSTLLHSILGEVPKLHGTIKACGSFAYVSQVAWIQCGTIRDNILFGLDMDEDRYAMALRACALDKDLESFPFRDLTEIGERGLNLSGGQKQRIQLARAVYQDAEVYLLDDPFSAVDAETGSMLFKNCILGALSKKTIILVTHQVEFLPSFDLILLMHNGKICQSGKYDELLVQGTAFEGLVNAHKDVMGGFDELPTGNNMSTVGVLQKRLSSIKSQEDGQEPAKPNQLTKKEEKESGDTGMKAYMDYMNQANGFFYYGLAILIYLIYVAGQMSSNWWMATEVENPETSTGKLIGVYAAIGLTTGSCLFVRSVLIVVMGLAASKSFFSGMMDSLFSAPMSFFDSTPSGRILSRVSVDLSIIDLDVPFSFAFSVSAFLNALTNLAMTTSVTWQILVVVVPMMYLNRLLQVYYLASARELMRVNSTTKAPILNFFGEAISGVTTIRAFGKQEQFMSKILNLIDVNSSPFFCNFAAREWLIQRLETLWSAVLCSSALVMVLLPPGKISPGFVGLVLSYGLSLNVSQVNSVQNQCNLANMIISVERIKQYLCLPCEPLFKEKTGLPSCWPSKGKVELQNLQIRYRPDAPLVLRGITCIFEGGQKVGIVGRTGSGKTTLISALFRLVDPSGGRILVDGVDITSIGLTDLRSRLSIIPQEPTLFRGTIRFNLDPLAQFTNAEIWEALEKCQLGDTINEKPLKLDSFVGDDGENWSIGERQIFCLARALLKNSQILVLDEATASVDNATDAILQKFLRDEFHKCTTITVAHRIPTVITSDMVLSLEDGSLVEFDRPVKLLENRSSLFSRLVTEYWSSSQSMVV